MGTRPAESVTAGGVANIAPITAGSGALHTSADSLKFLRQNKHNPLPYLKPDMLSRVLEAFEHGRMREAVLLWEKMAERDDMIMNVKPKREKDVSQLDMQVVTEPESAAEGEAHKEVLLKFWKSIRAVNAYDRNERGGFRRLVKQMMTATSFKYAAHHIIWTPRPDGTLSATFEFVPLWLFENTTGKLRYLKSMSALTGEDLDDSEWMVTTGDGLMIACSIGYMAKRSAFNDWLIFSEKFSVPGVLGRTSAKAGTPEANAMTEATRAFGHDWCAVITGDDGTHAKPIEIIQASGNPAGMPMPAVIERVDRRIAALYRGADLSSMSAGAGDGTGASLQEKETDILRRDDAETIAETLAEVSRLVIEWHFGNGVMPLARVELVVPVQEDSSQVVTAATLLADRGAKVSTSALMDRLNLPKATDDADALSPAAKNQDSKNQESRKEVENAYNPLQARDPKGSEGGGRWTAGATDGKGKSAARGQMRPGTDADRKRLGVAPAFSALQVTDDAAADLLGTAKNAKGKTVYFYSEAYSQSQAAAKFARIGALHSAMPGLQAKIDEDILAGGADREQALALRMITLTGLRNGGEDGGGKVDTFGASNLRTDQVRVDGATVHMDFPGKKGVRQRHSFTDDKLARHITEKQKAGAGQVFEGDAGKTLGYLKKISGDKFKVHDFRTWHGTMLADATATKIAAKGEAPTTDKEFKIFRKRVGAVVGRQLGNDGAMSLKAYIHPNVFTPYQPKPGDSPRKKAA